MIQSIDRAARVLQLLAGRRHLGITELGSALALPPSTVHGIVKSLESHGLIAREPHGSRYMLGPALLKLSNVYLDTLDVRARAMRWTRELARRSRMAVRLGVELGEEVIVIHHNVRPDGSEQMPETGLSLPAHASALGKALLAYSPAASSALLRSPLGSLTGATITDPAHLAEQLALVAARALASEEEEAVLGECGLAAPVADRSGAVVAAVGVVLPSTEWPPEADVVAALRETARNISRELGAPAWPPTADVFEPGQPQPNGPEPAAGREEAEDADD
ncbi:MAG: IclR family transcriptional regulator [Microbacteriaceae bacterium]